MSYPRSNHRAFSDLLDPKIRTCLHRQRCPLKPQLLSSRMKPFWPQNPRAGHPVDLCSRMWGQGSHILKSPLQTCGAPELTQTQRPARAPRVSDLVFSPVSAPVFRKFLGRVNIRQCFVNHNVLRPSKELEIFTKGRKQNLFSNALHMSFVKTCFTLFN